LRQRIVDPRVLSPDTVMPPYFVTTGLTRVQTAYVGKTILSAQEVEDVVAYLASLE
jgi:L-cysteine S-thiosulfotransferase